jgi:hypothetical protein
MNARTGSATMNRAPAMGEIALNATVDTDGVMATAFFEYGPTANYDASTPAQSIAGGTAVLVSATISMQIPEHGVHYVSSLPTRSVPRTRKISSSTLARPAVRRSASNPKEQPVVA